MRSAACDGGSAKGREERGRISAVRQPGNLPVAQFDDEPLAGRGAREIHAERAGVSLLLPLGLGRDRLLPPAGGTLVRGVTASPGVGSTSSAELVARRERVDARPRGAPEAWVGIWYHGWTMSTRTASRVKAHLAEVIEAARESGEAITITKNGEGTAVLQGDLASYEAMRRSLAMLKVVAQSERDLARGRSISQHRVFRGLRKRLAAR